MKKTLPRANMESPGVGQLHAGGAEITKQTHKTNITHDQCKNLPREQWIIHNIYKKEQKGTTNCYQYYQTQANRATPPVVA